MILSKLVVFTVVLFSNCLSALVVLCWINAVALVFFVPDIRFLVMLAEFLNQAYKNAWTWFNYYHVCISSYLTQKKQNAPTEERLKATNNCLFEFVFVVFGSVVYTVHRLYEVMLFLLLLCISFSVSRCIHLVASSIFTGTWATNTSSIINCMVSTNIIE